MIKGKMFDLINNVRDSIDEEGYDSLMDLMKPDEFSKEVMEEIYEETLGYNPLTYFDSEAMKRAYDKISGLSFISDDVKEKMKLEKTMEKIKPELCFANGRKNVALAASVILNFCLDEDYMDHEYTEEETEEILNVLKEEFDIDKESFIIDLVRNYEIEDTSLSKESSMANNIHKKASHIATKNGKAFKMIQEACEILGEDEEN